MQERMQEQMQVRDAAVNARADAGTVVNCMVKEVNSGASSYSLPTRLS